MTDVSPVSYWYKAGHFRSEEEARGAFRLAYQQAMDGMGVSVQEWMGLSVEQFSAWMSKGELPDLESLRFDEKGRRPRPAARRSSRPGSDV